MESFCTSEIVRSGGCSIIKISPSSGPKYFSFQRREKNITEVHYSSSFRPEFFSGLICQLLKLSIYCDDLHLLKIHYSSSLAKINPVSFGVISDLMRNETKKLRIGKKNSCKTTIGEK